MLTASPALTQAANRKETMIDTNHGLTVKIVPNEKGNPPGKLGDAELHFTGGPLEGLKLIGFAVWERRTGSGRNFVWVQEISWLLFAGVDSFGTVVGRG